MDENKDYVTWQAVLEIDGEIVVVNQKDIFDDKLEYKPSYEELPRENLRVFRMVMEGGHPILQIPFKPGTGERLIWRRRKQVRAGEGDITVYVVGKRGAFVNIIMPDLTIITDDNFSEDSIIAMDVTPVKGEEGFNG